MTAIASPTRPVVAESGPLPIWPALRRLFGRLPFRDMFFAAAIVVSASAVLSAQEDMKSWVQDWVPGVLRLPADAEALTDRAIGSSIRMFSITTDEEAGALLDEWQTALDENGFVIKQASGELLERAIEFSGEGIANAKIVSASPTAEGRAVIKFDATLD